MRIWRAGCPRPGGGFSLRNVELEPVIVALVRELEWHHRRERAERRALEIAAQRGSSEG